MIIVKLISGLGNQLFQYAMARQLSAKNNVDLKLDVSFYETQSLRSYRLDKYNVKAEVATSDEIQDIIGIYNDLSLYGKVYRKIEPFFPKHKRKLYRESDWWAFEPEACKVSDNTYLYGYWQHNLYYKSVPNFIFDELSLKDTAECDNYEVFDQVKQDDNSVSLHIRRGDYITDKEANQLMGTLPVSYYEEAIAYLKTKIKAPSFYVFSDDLDWARDHLDKSNQLTFVDIDGGQKDYLELDLMSKCRHNIIANSSFSWWGGFLNRNPNKIVISPAQWVQKEEINQKSFLHCPGWVKL